MISVIIPLYNKEYSIFRAVDSVLAQTVLPVKIVIVDDGSTDNSLALVRNRYNSNELIEIFNKPNGGVSSARNFALGYIETRYVCFLDADDEWAACFIEKNLEMISEFPECKLFGCAHEIIYGDTGKSVIKVNSTENKSEKIVDFFQDSLRVSVVNSSKCCIEVEALKKVGLFPLNAAVGEDLHVWISLSLKYEICYCKDVLVKIYFSKRVKIFRLFHGDLLASYFLLQSMELYYYKKVLG